VARHGWFSIAGLLLSGLTFWTGVARGQVQRGEAPPHAVGEAGSDFAGPSISAICKLSARNPCALPAVIYVGDNFVIQGSGFTSGSVVNFFVPTSAGPQNFGPLIPSSENLGPPSYPCPPDQTCLLAFVPISVTQGEGAAGVEVVNTDESHIQSNTALAFLQGDASLGLPSLTAINGVALSPTSIDPGVALANVETVVSPSASVTLTGAGFDVVDGVGIDLFCDCPGGKVGPFLLYPGNPGLSASTLTFTLPSGTFGPATGPGAFRVTNLGKYFGSAAVSVPIGARIAVNGVAETGSAVTVFGAGFSSLTVQGGAVVNLGGLNPDGSPIIPINFDSDSQISFSLPAGAVAGPAYVQALNPPFIPFTSSGNDPGGAFEAR
jgi:hypothetical protein